MVEEAVEVLLAVIARTVAPVVEVHSVTLMGQPQTRACINARGLFFSLNPRIIIVDFNSNFD